MSAPGRGERVAPLVLCVGVLATVTAAMLVRSASLRAGAERFELLHGRITTAIRDRFAAYEQVLRGGVALFEASQTVDRAEWQAYVTRLEAHRLYPGIQGIGYVVHAAPEARPAIERAARADGLAGFTVHPRAGSEHGIILYLEPANERNRRAFGYDMLSEPVRRLAMARARDLGLASLSGKVRLRQETDHDVQPGFLMFLPHYQSGRATATVEERRRALRGWVYAPFRVRDFMNGVLGGDPSGIAVDLYDGDETYEQQLFTSARGPGTPLLRARTNLEIYGRCLTVRYASRPAFEATIDQSKVWITAAAGLLSTGLLFALILQLSSTRRRALVLAEEMTVAVRAGEAKLRAAMATTEAARDLALAGSRAKSEFLAAMSHEVRTPLNGIIGLSDLLGDSNLSERQRDLVRSLRVCGTSLLAVINDILDFSKIEAGKIEVEQIGFDPRELVDTVRTLVAETARQKPVGLLVEIAPALPPLLIGDAMRIQQVLLNLVANAVKFTEAGTVTIRVAPAGERVRFEVEDTGIGIPDEAQPRLFQAFTQADGSTTRKYGGTGLGLAISKRLVELMRGSIGVFSQVGKGSRFFFELPLAPGEAPPLLAAARAEPPAPGRALSILVAEDHAINRKVVGGMLEKAGHTVEMVADGRAAIEAVARARFDLVLMDVEMPVMDGLEACRSLRAAGQTLPILALTAQAMKTDVERCLAAGMDAYLPKPIDRRQLLDTIARLAAGAPAPELVPAGAPATNSGDPVDRAELLERVDGDEALLGEIVAIFLRDAPVMLGSVVAAATAKDAPALGRAAHALAGLLLNLAAHRAADSARALVRHAHDQDLDAAAPLIQHLSRELHAIERHLAPH